MPDKTGGAGRDNLNIENITPTKTPVASEVIISIMLSLVFY
jgi:hypothetical protein